MTSKTTGTAALYARFSSDLQQERSIDDQLALSKTYCSREGLSVVAVYSDRAKSGATLFDREGLMDLMRDAKSGRSSVVVVESLDRLSRDQEDLAAVYKRLSFAQVEIRTLNEGATTAVHVGLRGLVGSLFLADLGQKVRRGHTGRVREGLIPGSCAYGYKRVIGGRKGEQVIDPEQAKIVVRIFEEYAAGRSPRAICAALNADGVPGPRGGPWQPQILVGGDTQKRLLSNRTYVGEIVWNTRRTVRNPETGRTTKRVNEASEHVVVAVPHLAIIDPALWERAHAVRKAKALHAFGPDGRKQAAVIPRKQSLLAGLLRCEQCGGEMILGSKGSAGAASRFKCRNAHRGLDCDQTRSYDSGKLERTTLEGLRQQLADPRLLAIYVEEFRTRHRAQQRIIERERDGVRKRLSDIEASVMRFLGALERGSMSEDLIHGRLQELESERVALKERQRLADQDMSVVELHPQAVERYRHAVATLQEDLSSRELRTASREAFRNLVDHIVVVATPKYKPYETRIFGRLAAIIGINIYPTARSAVQVVAEAGGRKCARIDNRTSEKAGV